MNRVEILGVFGSGKTTLAHRTAAHDVHVLAERHEDNPWWGSGVNERLGFLAYELTFLLQHLHLVAKDDDSATASIAICDWSFLSDRLWASKRLADEFSAYDAVHGKLMSRIGPPIGYLYLRQPVDLIVERIARRGRMPEMAFLDAVADAVAGLEELVQSIPQHMLAVVDDNVQPQEVKALVGKWMEGLA